MLYNVTMAHMPTKLTHLPRKINNIFLNVYDPPAMLLGFQTSAATIREMCQGSMAKEDLDAHLNKI